MNYILPQLKNMVEFCVVGSKIYFFKNPGVAITLDDSKGFIRKVCALMDGEKNTATLKSMLSESYPEEAKYLEELLKVLDSEKLLEDKKFNTSISLNKSDEERYARNLGFFSSYITAQDNKYQYQEKLKTTKVVILGMGGVGTHVLQNLAGLGVGHIKIVDFDLVELSNLNRQVLYRESDLGELKAIAASKNIKEFSNDINITTVIKKIANVEDILELIKGQDIVIGAADQPRDKIIDWLNVACIELKIPFVLGSLDSQWAACYSIVPGKTGCIECWKQSVNNNKTTFQNMVQSENFISSAETNTAIMPLLSITAGLVAAEFLKIVTHIASPSAAGRFCVYDFVTSQMKVNEEWSKNQDCSICNIQ